MRGQLTVFVVHQQVLEDHRDVPRDDVVDGGPGHPADRPRGAQGGFGRREARCRSDFERVIAIFAHSERHENDEAVYNINVFITPLTRRDL